jgi:hypothetical protein
MTRARARVALTLTLAVTVALLLAACGGERASTPAGPPRPPPEAITKVSENGPVKATVKVWPPSPELGDPLYLELTIEAAPGVTVAAPFEDDGLGRFAAGGLDPRHRAQGRRRHRRGPRPTPSSRRARASTGCRRCASWSPTPAPTPRRRRPSS